MNDDYDKTNPARDIPRFPAAQVPSVDANTLEDYEEGLWPALLTQDGEDYQPVRPARYSMTGRAVFATAAFDVPEVTGIVTGLPFEPAGDTVLDSVKGSIVIAFDRKLP